MSAVIRALARFQKKRYWRLGLMTQDVIRHDHAVYKEAVALLPPEILEERQMRISRAFLYDSQAKLAPKNEWINEDTDVDYLSPYIAEAQRRLVAEQTGKQKIESYRLTPKIAESLPK